MPKKMNSKAKTKSSKQSNYSELTEIFKCNVIDFNLVNGDSILIYKKKLDKALSCCRIHPSINSSFISDIKKALDSPIAKALGGNPAPFCWIAIWNDLDELYIKNYAPTLEDLIQQIDVRKADTMNMHEDRRVFTTVGERSGLDLDDDNIPF